MAYTDKQPYHKFMRPRMLCRYYDRYGQKLGETLSHLLMGMLDPWSVVCPRLRPARGALKPSTAPATVQIVNIGRGFPGRVNSSTPKLSICPPWVPPAGSSSRASDPARVLPDPKPWPTPVANSREQSGATRPHEATMLLSTCTSVGREGARKPLLDDWIRYHRLIGAEPGCTQWPEPDYRRWLSSGSFSRTGPTRPSPSPVRWPCSVS